MNVKKTFQSKVKEAIDIAIDLGYDKKCIKDLTKAKSDIQIDNILISARRRMI